MKGKAGRIGSREVRVDRAPGLESGYCLTAARRSAPGSRGHQPDRRAM